MRSKTKGRKLTDAQRKAAIEAFDKRQLNVRITNRAYEILANEARGKGLSIAGLLEVIARSIFNSTQPDQSQ